MRRILSVIGAFAVAASLVMAAGTSQAADHLEAPLVQRDGRTDINDIYAFRAQRNGYAALVMTVNPGAGAISGTTFRPGARYVFEIDADGDAATDHRYQIVFGRVRDDGRQRMRVWLDGERIAVGRTGRTVKMGEHGRARSGVFDDPFFFDLQAFRDQVEGAGGSRTFCDATPTDFFSGLNVSAIVLEVPVSDLGSETVGVWGRTRLGNTTIDRMGRPAISTVFVENGLEDAFNATHPSQDRALWTGDVVRTLETLSGLDGTPYTREQAAGIAEFLLPDILTVDFGAETSFPNGRALADDVIDVELPIVTGGFFEGGTPVLTSDCVDGDSAFRSSFPYLARANR